MQRERTFYFAISFKQWYISFVIKKRVSKYLHSLCVCISSLKIPIFVKEKVLQFPKSSHFKAEKILAQLIFGRSLQIHMMSDIKS